MVKSLQVIGMAQNDFPVGALCILRLNNKGEERVGVREQLPCKIIALTTRKVLFNLGIPLAISTFDVPLFPAPAMCMCSYFANLSCPVAISQ